MDRDTRNAAIAALVILALFFAFAYYLPVIMLAVGEVSGFLAGIVAAVFMLALFMLFWMRSRSQRDKGK